MEMTYEKWLEFKNIHDRFDKHNSAMNNPRNPGDYQICSCGMCLQQTWQGRREPSWGWVEGGQFLAAVKENRVNVLRWYLENYNEHYYGSFTSGMPKVLFAMPNTENLKDLRPGVLKHGGAIALAYAMRMSDTGDDLYEAVKKNPDSWITWIKKFRGYNTDETRKDFCRRHSGHMVVKYAEEIDGGYHTVTSGAARRTPAAALEYYSLYEKSIPSYDVKFFRAKCMSQGQTAASWIRLTNEKVTNDGRRRVCRTQHGAWMFAMDLDKEHANNKIYRDKLLSTNLALRYNLEVMKKRSKYIEDPRTSTLRSWEVVRYQLAHGKHCEALNWAHMQNCNKRMYPILSAIRHVHKTKMTEEQALKKSVYALAYLFLHKDYNNKRLVDRLCKNRTYEWFYTSVKDEAKDIHAKKCGW